MKKKKIARASLFKPKHLCVGSELRITNYQLRIMLTIGVCDNCSNRYYSADILHTVHAIATVAKSPDRTEQIPVAHLESV